MLVTPRLRRVSSVPAGLENSWAWSSNRLGSAAVRCGVAGAFDVADTDGVGEGVVCGCFLDPPQLATPKPTASATPTAARGAARRQERIRNDHNEKARQKFRGRSLRSAGLPVS